MKLPEPRLSFVYRLEAALGEPFDLGDTVQGRRRIAPLIGGTFTGPDISGTQLPGGSADWQIIEADGTSRADLRYTLETTDGALLYVQASGVRHGTPEVLARLDRHYLRDLSRGVRPDASFDGRGQLQRRVVAVLPCLKM